MRKRQWLAGLIFGALASACGGAESGGTTPPVVVPPTPVATTVTVSPAAMSLEIGATTTLVADVRDQAGVAMIGQVVTWLSSNTGIAAVNAASGLVTGAGVGSATISATAGGRSGAATVTVTPLPLASITIAPLAGSLAPGQSAQLVATLKDRSGALLSGRTVTWSSSATAVATSDNTGKVTAVSAGSATITASSDGISGTVTVVVSGAGVAAPVISGIAPATLVPGTTATITGSGFDAQAGNNLVTIRGVPAKVTFASATQLTATVPCVGSGSAQVQVTSNALAGPSFTHAVSVTQRTLPVGQAIVLTDASCNEFATSGSARYVVSVFSAASSPNSLVDFELAGNTPASASPAKIVPPAFSLSRGDFVPGPDASRDRAHLDMLERNRATYLEFRTLAARQPLRSRSVGAVAAPPAIGEPRDFFFTYTGGCRDTSTKMHTQAIYVGARAIIWEDSTNSLRSANDAALNGFYQRLGEIFDQDQYDIIKSNFGDPLRRNAVLANDGRVNMVFSEKLNGTGAAAFVTSCDQFPPTGNTSGSNFGHVFYGTVPTIRGSNLGSTLYPDGWFIFMGRTVVHEVKHIAAFSARVANNAPTFEESWLEEGAARHAEEMWVRTNLEKVAWKANTGFGSAATNGIYCDFHPENATCNAADALRRPSYGMRRHFNELRSKLQQPWNWSAFGDGTGQIGSVFYQTAWSLVRYAIDRFGISDADFLTRLTNSNGSGLNNMATITGATPDQLMGTWGLSLYADDYPGLASPAADIQFPTWNLRNIYAGLNADPTWGGQFPTPFPIIPVPLAFGSFTAQRTGLRGGANAYFELSGPASVPQLLNVRAMGGGTLSPNLRIAIARLQ